jgi:hypothetical protein
MLAFEDGLALVEETDGFRYLYSRDLTGGSYVHMQRHVHDLAAWGASDDQMLERMISADAAGHCDHPMD